MTKNNSSMEVVWAVRDARGLNSNEKVFLFVVASRGTLKASRETTLEDCGFKKDTFYKVVKSLTAKGLIEVHEGRYNPVSNKRDQTYYTIVLPALIALHDSVSQKEDSVSQKEDSVSQNHDSVEPDNKVTVKVTDKVTEKVTTTPAPPVGAKDVGEVNVEVSDFSLDVDSPLGLVEPSPALAVNKVAAGNQKVLEGHRAKKNALAERMSKAKEEQAERVEAFRARRKSA